MIPSPQQTPAEPQSLFLNPVTTIPQFSTWTNTNTMATPEVPVIPTDSVPTYQPPVLEVCLFSQKIN